MALSMALWEDWVTRSRDLLYSNVIEVDGFRFTRPAPNVYEHQWLWDSAFHAIVYRWFDTGMASDELVSDAAHQLQDGADAGMIPHMSYWRGGGTELWGVDRHSLITQPPLLAVAARLVYERADELPLLEALYPRLVRHHEWFKRRRDMDGDGLVCILHPWESWDASPRWDKSLGLTPFSHEAGRAARMALAATVREYAGDARALARGGRFCVKAVDVNAMRAADLEALSFLAMTLGRDGEAQRWQAEAEAVQRAVSEKLLANGGYDLKAETDEPIVVDSASVFMALYGGCASPQQAGALVERLRAPNYWTTYPVPTTPSTSPDYAPDTYWRGNVWMQVNWLIYMGLRRYGYVELASELAERSVRLVQQSGFWEYYDPQNGMGLGAEHQSWSALALDMLGQELGV